LKGKNPLKSVEAVRTQLIAKMDNDVVEEEWSDIVKYMYAPEDSGALVSMIREVIRQTNEPEMIELKKGGAHRGRVPPGAHKAETALKQGRIAFKTFLKVSGEDNLDKHHIEIFFVISFLLLF